MKRILIFLGVFILSLVLIQIFKENSFVTPTDDSLLSLPYLEYSTAKADLNKMGITINKINHQEYVVILGNTVIDANGNYLRIKECPGNFPISRYGRLFYDEAFKLYNLIDKNYFIHHDIIVLNNSNILFLTKEFHMLNSTPMLFDKIIEVDKSGNEVFSWSSFYHKDELNSLTTNKRGNEPIYFLNDSDTEIPNINSRLNISYTNYSDYYHMNSLYEISENAFNDSRFKKGNILASIRKLDAIILIEKETGKIIWSFGPNETIGQHAPTFLKNGNILIFDNGNFQRNYSRIIEINPFTKSVEWEYKKNDFFSHSRGFMQRLENNHTFITESETGRLFEIDENKKIVWEYFSPIIDKRGNRQLIYRAFKMPISEFNISQCEVEVLWKQN